MTKTQRDRLHRLLPFGVPRYVRCYDNGDTPDATIDRYTVVFTGRYLDSAKQKMYLAMSALPYHPQGFCQHGESTHTIDSTQGKWPPAIGRKCHLGKRIRFQELPVPCQRIVRHDYKELWDLKEAR